MIRKTCTYRGFQEGLCEKEISRRRKRTLGKMDLAVLLSLHGGGGGGEGDNFDPSLNL